MELINKNVIENRHFKIVAKVIRDILHKKENDTVYESFKSHLIFLGESIMKNYLEETGLIKDKRFKEFSFVSKKLPYKILGRHSKGNIVIDNKVIEGLYNGNVGMLETFFHELSHFKIYCDINMGIPDIYLYTILKEKLIVESIDKYNSNYYDTNYSLITEEVYVELLALIDFLKFIKLIDLKIIDSFLYKLISIELEDIMERWDNKERNLSRIINFNDNYMNINDIFDLQLRYNKKWLEEYPLLKIEYYVDKDGNVVKRSAKELRELLNTETDNQKKEFISRLISKQINIENLYSEIVQTSNENLQVPRKKIKKFV